MTANLDALTADLRQWIANHDPHVQAAVNLLIEHDYWLRTGRFVKAAVVKASDGHYIAWSKAREAYDAGEFDRSSTSELAVLDLAIALGENRFKLTSMGRVNGRSMAQAFASALGLNVEAVGTQLGGKA